MAISSPEYNAILRENIALSLIPAFYDCTLVWDETYSHDPSLPPGHGRVTYNGGCKVTTRNGESRDFYFEECTSKNIMDWLADLKAFRDDDGSWAKMMKEISK